jgi:mannonate dehydratase
MRITTTEALVTRPGRNFVLVKIATDTGLVGWGDATLNGRELSVASYLNDHVAPLLEGEDPLRIEHLYNALRVGSYWRGGPVQHSALSGVDMALWDILGKEAGQPVYQLLGGRCREDAACYVHCSGTTPDELVDAARARMQAGFRHLRVQLMADVGSTYGERAYRPRQAPDAAGPVEPAAARAPSPDDLQPALSQQPLPFVGVFDPSAYLRETPALFRHVRDAVGEDVELLHDVHHRLTPTQAARLAKDLEPYRPFFLEDAVAPELATYLDQVRGASTTPLALGEGLFDVEQCLPLITGRLVDFLRCDLGHCGGITAGRKLATLCEPFGIKTAWHGPPDLSPVGHAANVHLDLASPNFGIQEWTDHFVGPDAADAAKVFRGGVTCRDGALNVADTPGLGVEINEEAARSFAYERAYLPVCRLPDGTVHPW